MRVVCVVLASLLATIPGVPRAVAATPLPARHVTHRMFTCSLTGGAISPCTITDTLVVNKSRSEEFLVTNNTSLTVTDGISCTVSGTVQSCSASPNSLMIASHDGKFTTVTFTAGSTAGTGTVSVQSSGFNGSLTATINVIVMAAPVVTPKALAINQAPQTAYSQNFSVKNPGLGTATYSLNATCSTTVTCTQPASPITVLARDSTTVAVSYTTNATGPSGVVALHATRTDIPATDSGYVTTTFGFLSVSDTITNNDNQDVGLCAISCFTAAYAQSTVPYISLNTPRAVTIAYNGDRLAVRPFIVADVSLRSNAPSVQQYWLQAQVNWGGGWTRVTFMNGDTTLHFSVPNASQRMRLAGQLDASTQATGAYPLRITVTAQYTTTTETFTDSTQKLLIVNDRHSPYGRGWTVAGVQRLYLQGDSSAVVTDGGGSAQYFRSCGAHCFGSPIGEYSVLTSSGSGATLTYRRGYPDSTVAVFNQLGQLTTLVRVTAADTIRYGYDALGRVDSVTDPYRSQSSGAPALIALTYFADSIRIQEPGPAGQTGGGRTTTLKLGSDSTLQAVTDPDGISTNFRYDTQQRLSNVIDRRGDTTHYAYRTDSSWKLASVIAPRVPVDNGAGGTTLQTPATTLAAWQVVDVPTSSTAVTPYVPVLTDSVWAVVTDPLGHELRFTADRFGQIVRVVAPYGQVSTFARTGGTQPRVQITRPTGAVDSLWYDSDGRLSGVKTAGDSTTTITYGAYGRPTRIAAPNQPTETFVYGARGTDSLVTMAGATTHLFVDARGRDTMVVDPAGHTSTLYYDPRSGNEDSVVAPGDRWSRTIFDQYGRDSVHSANGLSGDTVQYDVLNRVIRRAVPGLGVTLTTYDALFPIRVRDPKGNVYRVAVDALGRTGTWFDPADTLNRFITYRYSANGLPASTTNRRGQRIDVAYDSLDRPKTMGGPTNIVADSFSYNPTGTIVVGWNAVSMDSVFTSPSGWVDSVVTRRQPANTRYRRYYHHNNSMQLDSVGLATTSGITFANAHYYWNVGTGALDSIGTGTNRAVLGYTPEFLDSTITWPGSVVETLTHTSTHFTASTSFTVAAVNQLLARTYGYADSLGHITMLGWQSPGFGTIQEFAYSPAGELQSNSIDSLTAAEACTPPTGTKLRDDGQVCQSFTEFNQVRNLEYVYDSAGNLTAAHDSLHSTTTTGTYGAGDRLIALGGATYTMDKDGHDSTRTAGGSTTTFAWTADGHLSTVTRGSVTLSYAYDAFGQLAQRSRKIGSGAVTLERQFLWDQGQLLAELDSSGTHRIAQYAYWPGVDAPFALVTGAQSVTATRYFALDETQNVTGVFSATGVTQSLAYQPFGMLDSAYLQLGTLADTNRLRWKGLFWEGDSTQLYYVRNRWYDPRAQRFAGEDPLGLEGGINTYAFGGNDPINHSDPSGECTVGVYLFGARLYGYEVPPGGQETFDDGVFSCGCNNTWQAGPAGSCSTNIPPPEGGFARGGSAAASPPANPRGPTPPTCSRARQIAAALAENFDQVSKTTGYIALGSGIAAALSGAGEGITLGTDTPLTVTSVSATSFFGTVSTLTGGASAALRSFANGNLQDLRSFGWAQFANITAKGASLRIPGIARWADTIGDLSERAFELVNQAQEACP